MTERGRKAPRNWPLWIGLVLLIPIVLLAWRGPRLAPRDPVKPVYIVQHPQTLAFVRPPFRPGQMPGFPLGADPLGRDTLSQILWALRPTLALVVTAATVRLLLGLILGVASGWGSRGVGMARLLEGIMSVALSVPLLLAALCVAAALGPRWGVWAFILGLCLTGWAEAARVIHDQTRLIQTQPYIEAARALGAPDLGIVGRHVLPHVLPMVWILLPLEISTALVVTAGLGFLGYFVNAIWVPLGDWTAVRAAGQPELGQMLAGGAAIAAQHPWLLLTAGATIFLLVLTFNLLGEGLRRQTDPARARRRKGRLAAALARGGRDLGQLALERLAMGRGGLTTALGLAALLLLTFVSVFALLRAAAIPTAASRIAIPGGHLWAAGRHDAQGAYWANTTGPTRPQIAWTLRSESGWVGGPAVAASGVLYLAAEDGRVYAVTPDGQVLWIARLPGKPFGSPALNAEGHLYVLDSDNVLYVLDAAGDLIWALRAEAEAKPLSSPVVDAAGVAYLATERSLMAVRPFGELVWRRNLPTYSYVSPQPTLSPDGRRLFFEDIALDAATGQTLIPSSDAILDRYLVGADGSIYLAGQERVARAVIDGDQLHLELQAQIDLLNLSLGFRIPSAAGVAPSGRIWVFYASSFDFPKLLWTEPTGSALHMIDYPWSGSASLLVALDQNGAVYACGNNARAQTGGLLECSGYLVDRPATTWKLALEPKGVPLGGALASGRLYVVSHSTLYAIESGK